MGEARAAAGRLRAADRGVRRPRRRRPRRRGPWLGPASVYDPPEVVRGGTTVAYVPFAHPEQGGPGLLLSYDVNDTRRMLDAVGLFRPASVRVTLHRPGPGPGGERGR